MIFRCLCLDLSSGFDFGTLTKDNIELVFPSAKWAITPKCSSVSKCHTPPLPLGFSLTAQSEVCYMKIGVVFISRSIFNPYGLIDTFIRMTNPKKRKYALSLNCSILIDMKTTLLTIMIIGFLLKIMSSWFMMVIMS